MSQSASGRWRPTERRLAAQYAVTRALAEASTLDDATPEILKGICTSLGWEFGALWRPDSSGDDLGCVAVWRASDALQEFEEFSRTTTLRPGIGLPGRVWSSGKSAWIQNVLDDRNFPRAPVAAREGIHAGFAFPILVGGHVLGVMEFFSRDIRAPNAELLAMAEVIGSQIGQFIERKGAEAAVRATEARHAAILESALDCVITIDHRGDIMEFNPAAERMFGYGRDTVVGREMCELIIPPSLRERHRAGLARYLATGDGPVLARRIEVTGMRADGTQFPVELAITRVDIPGPPIFTGYLRDITERKLADQALRESEARLAAVIKTIGDAVLVFDADGRFMLANPAADELLGAIASFEDLVGRVEPASDALAGQGDRPLSEWNGDQPIQVRLRGDDRWLELNRYAVDPTANEPSPGELASGGRVPSTILLVRDVTDLRNAQAARDAFLGILSHELRTPITTIYAGAEVLGRVDKPLPEAIRRELTADIKDEARRLELLVEDLLILTRFERGGMELGQDPVLLQRILPAVVESERKRWPSTTFRVDLPIDLPTVQGDVTYIEQLTRNLITNAAKYGGQDGVVQVTGRAARGRVEVRVLDEGPGFSDAELPQLFDLFYRAPGTLAVAGGAGIGLFVAKRLAEAMGGHIWAARRERGAEFGFSLRALEE